MCMALDRWGEIEEALRIRDVQLEAEARKLLRDADAGRSNLLRPEITGPAVAEPVLAGK